jgi:hypothetical protein
MTLHLPESRLHHLEHLLTQTQAKKRVSWRKYQKLLGTLRSSVPSLYGANNLFSSLQHALVDNKHNRIRIMPLI